MKDAPFSRPALILLLASAVGLFALSLLLHAGPADPAASGNTNRPSSYSISALGHAGFYDTLRRLDRPVQRGLSNPLAQVGRQGTLILAEPDPGRIAIGRPQLTSAPRLLLVLPKWWGRADPAHPQWIATAAPLSEGEVLTTLDLVSAQADIRRIAWPSGWQVNSIGVTPTDPSGQGGAVQLIRSESLRPVVGTSAGMLVAELRDGDRVVWILSDPDVMSNHGLGKGDNAAFMVALVDGLRTQNNSSARGTIVFDETSHGFTENNEAGSLMQLLFRFPFSVVIGLVCASAALLALAGVTRFGTPRLPAPELDFGKRGLIGNGARLLDYAGHHAMVLQRYARMTVRSVGQALHAPPGLDEAALAAWLDRVGSARGVQNSCSVLLQTVAAVRGGDTYNLTRLFECARDIHRWKGEMLYGSTTRRRHS